MTTTTSRRALIASAAALPALAVPVAALAMAAPADPIFAAIEQHRKTEAAGEAACRVSFDDRTEDLAGKLVDQSNSELAALVAMTPTTHAGWAALLRYVEGYIRDAGQGQLFDGFRDVEAPASDLLSRVAATLDGTAG